MEIPREVSSIKLREIANLKLREISRVISQPVHDLGMHYVSRQGLKHGERGLSLAYEM